MMIFRGIVFVMLTAVSKMVRKCRYTLRIHHGVHHTHTLITRALTRIRQPSFLSSWLVCLAKNAIFSWACGLYRSSAMDFKRRFKTYKYFFIHLKLAIV